MKAPIIGRKVNDEAIDSLIDALESAAGADDIFYVGYPVATTAESPITVPALLISAKYGLVCFDVVPGATEEQLDELRSKQRKMTLALKAKLLAHPSLADEEGEDLAFKVNVITFALTCDDGAVLEQAKIVDAEGLKVALKKCKAFDLGILPALNASIERVANIRPPTKRAIAKTANSKGSILRQIESEIANLDSWQKAAAIETPDGPQRIRGLAGSGKTIVLALKAAYLHGENRTWKIGVTFHTRALKQQFKSLIRRFYFEDYRDDPDDSLLEVIHSFGSLGEPGIYAQICSAYGIAPRDFGYAKRTYGYSRGFAGICAELLQVVEQSPKVVFDALLIDEAQDMPREFLRLAYLCTRNHRIVWAYDDLQNLGDYQMQSLRETFGEDEDGNPLVKLSNQPKRPREDIILPKCYRNTPWALVTAHALGSGIYRATGIVQHPDDPVLWGEIGYEVVKGELELGKKVVLRRSPESSPSFFEELLTADAAVQFHRADDVKSQFLLAAQMIKADLTTGELYPHDIAVVFPDAINAETRGLAFRQYLADQGIDSHLVGITSSRDGFVIEGKVAVSGPFRAKGNEAPMVYLIDADFCATGSELIKKRNILFTGITRSRGWIRVFGCGEGMKVLEREFDKLKAKQFRLEFTVPTLEQLKKIRTLYRDISKDDRKKVTDLKKALDRLPDNDEEAAAMLQALPKALRDRFLRGLKDVID
ncbi:MAG: ATP-binding domain-containing protein [Opitutaceae bacterium]